jgi:hypothetical protein
VRWPLEWGSYAEISRNVHNGFLALVQDSGGVLEAMDPDVEWNEPRGGRALAAHQAHERSLRVAGTSVVELVCEEESARGCRRNRVSAVGERLKHHVRPERRMRCFRPRRSAGCWARSGLPLRCQ